MDATTFNIVLKSIMCVGLLCEDISLLSPRRPCVMHVCSPNNVARAVQTHPTLLRYASVIVEQKKCWEFFNQKFYWFQTLHQYSQQHSTTGHRVCKLTQHVTSNSVESCWPTKLHLFEWGLSQYETNIIYTKCHHVKLNWCQSFSGVCVFMSF